MASRGKQDNSAGITHERGQSKSHTPAYQCRILCISARRAILIRAWFPPLPSRFATHYRTATNALASVPGDICRPCSFGPLPAAGEGAGRVFERVARGVGAGRESRVLSRAVFAGC